MTSRRRSVGPMTARRCRRLRGRALGRRGDARRPARPRPEDRRRRALRDRDLPRRRARPLASAAARARRAGDRRAGDPDSGRAALARAPSASSRGPSDRRRRPASSHRRQCLLRHRESSRPEERRIPETVRDVVLARVAQLSSPATIVVEAAAVAPPSLDAALTVAVCGEAADAVDECLASASPPCG